MAPAHYRRALHRSWLVIGALTVTGALSALAVSMTQTPLYKSSVELFFSSNIPVADVSQADQGGNYIIQRVRSYKQIAGTQVITAPVAQTLGLPYSADQLSAKVEVNSPPGTTVLNITVTDPSPERARDIANAIAAEFPRFIERAEIPAGGTVVPIKVAVVRPATLPTAPATPQTAVNVAMGLVAGALAGVGTAFARYAVNRSVRDSEHAAKLTGAPLLGVVTGDPAPAAPDAESTSYQSIAASLQRRSAEGGLATFAIASPDPSVAAAASAGIAAAVARAGQTTVLIDADTERSGLAAAFGIPDDLGLVQALTGQVSINKALQQFRPDLPLYVLPPGGRGTELTDALGMPSLGEFVRSFRSNQAVVLINTAAQLSPRVAAVTDAAVVVAEVGTTAAADLAKATQAVGSTGVTVLGVVAIEPAAKPRG